jgi:hypothetical protein
MALNKPGRCRRCGKPYSSTQHMRDCKGMSIKQRSAARSKRNAVRRASRMHAGGFFAAPLASACYYEDQQPNTEHVEGGAA